MLNSCLLKQGDSAESLDLWEKDFKKVCVTGLTLSGSGKTRTVIALCDVLLKNGWVTLIKQNEAYTSQTSPLSESVTKESAKKNNRIKRGLYKDGDKVWNADCVGAYNILRLYLSKNNKIMNLKPDEINNPYVVKVAV